MMRTHSPVRQDQLVNMRMQSLQSDLLVVRARCDIMDVGMELDSVDIGEVPGEDSERDVLLGVPQLGGAIVGAGDEVLSQRRELDLPDWEAVAVEHVHETSLLQRPEAN